LGAFPMTATALRMRSTPADGGPPTRRWIGADQAPHVRLLDGFELQHLGESLALTRSMQRLIAFLAVHKRPLLRGYVAGTLWMDFTEARSQANLRTTIWRLEQFSVPLVERSLSRVTLARHVMVDVRELDRLGHKLLDPSEELSAAELGAPALTMLSADLLPGWDDDDWVVCERERLRQIRLLALEAMACRLIDLGRHGQAVAAALAAVRTEPLRESAHRALIRAHLAGGNCGEALRQYHEYRALLDAELGLEPSAILENLIRCVLPRPPRDK
jgi:DNA-binding SARP family transcriptional activator